MMASAFLLMITTVAILSVTTALSQQALLGCPSKCGDVSIPYPFGVSEGSFFNSHFSITCNYSMSSTSPFWVSYEVIDITLEGELRVYNNTVSFCVPNQTTASKGSSSREYISYQALLPNPVLDPVQVTLPAFALSSTKNKFMAVGCNILATVIQNGGNVLSGCMITNKCSNNRSSAMEDSCDGSGCCQTVIPKNLTDYSIKYQPYSSAYNSTSPCSYIFIGEESSFTFSREDLTNMGNRTRVRTVVDWAIWNETCEAASRNLSSYACKAANSECYQPQDINGYRCNCSKGYQGNPYIPHGCKDVDECKNPEDNDCYKICENTIGSYKCSCPRGFHGDGRRGGERCILDGTRDNMLSTKITVGVSVGTSLVLFIIGFLYLAIKKRNLIKLKEKYFKQNGGILLQQQLRDRDTSSGSGMRIFTAEELKRATDNYSDTRILGRGGYGTVYKGILPNNTVVAIKKSKGVDVDHTQVEQFVNEVIVLSQINHRNVVKLLGCCFETAVPLLVYEFISNGTLYDHIHNRVTYYRMSWKTRLRIATETAGVLSYLHSAASIPIIHRDIKSTNILLDENDVAKVSDFGTLRLIPLDKIEVSTMVQGTLGYLDPEYLRTSNLTEKSDVYSFGVVLVELLTGKKALSFDKPVEERCLSMYFLSMARKNRLFLILEDSMVRNDIDAQQVGKVVMLARRCLRIKGEERPNMKEVAMELESIRAMDSHPWVNAKLNSDEDMESFIEETHDFIACSDFIPINASSSVNQAMTPVATGR